MASGRIVHLFNSSIVSGPETLVLPALPKLGRPVTVVFLLEARRRDEGQKVVRYAEGLGLETRVVEVRSRLDFQAIRGLARTLEELAPEVVHAHDAKASTYLLKAARARRGRAPYLLFSTHHGVRGRSGLKVKLYERVYARLVLPFFDRVLAVCTSDRELLVRRGLKPERVLAHLNGVDRPRVAPEDRARAAREIRGRWDLAGRGIPEGAVILGVVGRLAPEKRLDRMLSVASRVEQLGTRLDWRVVVFGTGPMDGALREQARLLGLDRRVHWLGYRNGVGSELAGLDLLLSFSDAEGLPINLVEAGWAGTPVYATRVDGNLDLVPSSREGELVPVEAPDAELARRLADLIDAPERRQAMGLAFQERVEREFSGERWVAQLRGLYDQALREARPGPAAGRMA